MTAVLAAFCAFKKKSRLAIAFQRGYNDCEGPNSFIKAALRIARASSNPATLAHDLQLFHEGGYRLCSIQPMDLFPQILHIETVILISAANFIVSYRHLSVLGSHQKSMMK